MNRLQCKEELLPVEEQLVRPEYHKARDDEDKIEASHHTSSNHSLDSNVTRRV